jgi:hypothetical protein
MSRAERRAYKRLTRNQDPYQLPAAAQRGRAARARPPRAQQRTGEFQLMTGRFLAWALGGATAAGLIGLSITWPQVPLALYVGLAVAAAWLAVAWIVRLAQRRMAHMPRPGSR